MTNDLANNLINLLSKYNALKNISRNEGLVFKHSDDSWGHGYATGQAAAYEDVIADVRKVLAKTSETPKAA
jgi:hypothetical protein